MKQKEESQTMKWTGIFFSIALAIVGMAILLYNLVAIMSFTLIVVILVVINRKRIERVTKTRLNVKIE